MTEQKWNLKRINHGFESEVPDFNPPQHFFKYKLRLLGAKVNDGQFSETRFLIVSLFIWCCLRNRSCYVCTLISSMELFTVILKIFNGLMNFLNMPSQETLHGHCTLSRSLWNEAFIKTCSFQNWCCYYGKIFIHQPRRQHWESFQRVMKQYLHMWNQRKRELRRKIWKKGFSKMAVSETQMEMRTFMYQQLLFVAACYLYEQLYI